MQCAWAILSSVAALQHFSTFSHKRHDFRKKLLDIKCVFRVSLQRLSETFFILRRTERDRSKMYICLHRKYPLFFVTFQWNLKFLDRFSKNTQISNLMKIGSLGVELFHADWPTDRQTYIHTYMSKLTIAFRNFANAPKSFEFSVYLLIYIC